MDNTGIFIITLFILGIIWSIIKTALDIWKRRTSFKRYYDRSDEL